MMLNHGNRISPGRLTSPFSPFVPSDFSRGIHAPMLQQQSRSRQRVLLRGIRLLVLHDVADRNARRDYYNRPGWQLRRAMAPNHPRRPWSRKPGSAQSDWRPTFRASTGSLRIHVGSDSKDRSLGGRQCPGAISL